MINVPNIISERAIPVGQFGLFWWKNTLANTIPFQISIMVIECTRITGNSTQTKYRNTTQATADNRIWKNEKDPTPVKPSIPVAYESPPDTISAEIAPNRKAHIPNPNIR